MDYNFNKIGNIYHLALQGNLLSSNDTNALMEEIASKIEERNNLFIVDMQEVKFINSMGLSMLLTILTKARKAGGEVVLINIPEQLSKLLIMTKLSSVFTVIDNMELALDNLQKLANKN